MNLVRWLAGDRWCPLRGVAKARRVAKKSNDGPLLTSKGRSPLGIALEDQKLDIVHYLVAEKRMSLFEEKDVSSAVVMANFTSMLRMTPNGFFDDKVIERSPVPSGAYQLSSLSGSLHSVPPPMKPSSDSTHSRSTAASTVSGNQNGPIATT